MLDLLLANGSYLLIVAILVLTAWGLPVPEEIPVAAAGILSAYGRLNAWTALGCCLVGAVVGDCLMYWIGYHFGPGVLWRRRWFARLVPPRRQAKAEHMFRRHGFKVLFVARFLVGLRSPVYLSAGMLGLPFRRFLLIDLISAGTVVCTFFAIAYFWGQSLVAWISRAEVLLTVVVVVGACGLGLWLWRRRRSKLASAQGLPSPGSSLSPRVCSPSVPVPRLGPEIGLIEPAPPGTMQRPASQPEVCAQQAQPVPEPAASGLGGSALAGSSESDLGGAALAGSSEIADQTA